MPSRRDFLKVTSAAAAGLLIGRLGGNLFAQSIPGGTLDPRTVNKYAWPLVIPPAMPMTTQTKNVDVYNIAVRQFQQQIVPGKLTTLWSYGSASKRATQNYPAFTIEAQADRSVRITWINGLVDAVGNYLPHLLPVDQTLHWANPPGGLTGRDTRPAFAGTPAPYSGPVPLVTHVHGAHASEESDGYAEAWYLPAALNIPAGYATVGTWYDRFQQKSILRYGKVWKPGTATFRYTNDQPATTLWYHDHALGMTRTNVYAGPAGFYLIRGGAYDLPDDVLPGPAPGIGANPFGSFYEIPIAIQDRSFNADGSLFYPSTRAFFDGATALDPGYIPDSDLSPIWNPEFFGNMMVVNGRTWPSLTVEARRYRLRLLNGCNSRFLILKIASDPTVRPANAALPFWQIGAEQGFLSAPVALEKLLMAPAERADVIVDFTGLAGTELYLINEGPDEPFGGGEPGIDFNTADPGSTGQVMKFTVVPLASTDTSVDPASLVLPRPPALGAPDVTRRLSLNEMMSMSDFDGPAAAMLGVVDSDGNPMHAMWMDPITENPALNATETWEFYNFTADAHPIHIHLVKFEVVDRQALITNDDHETEAPARLVGDSRPPESWETGFKDTVIAYPGEVTRVRAKFDLPGLYVWHCHIVEHEDNEMMRPFRVGP